MSSDITLNLFDTNTSERVGHGDGECARGSCVPISSSIPETGQSRRRPFPPEYASPIGRRDQSSSGGEQPTHPENDTIGGNGSTNTRPRKRPRQGNSDLTFDLPDTAHEEQRDSQLRTVIIHQVQCQAEEFRSPAHADHPKLSTFLDPPRLFNGDCGASVIRGELPIRNLDDYLEAREDIGVVVLRTHKCPLYHSAHDRLFSRLPMPKNPSISGAIRPYFNIMRADGPISATYDETIRPSERLNRALQELGSLDPALTGCHLNLTPPYLHMWHVREMVRPKEVLMTQPSSALILLLMDYIEHEFGHKYREAEDSFSRGWVGKEHLAWLFRPNEIVVTIDDEKEATCSMSLKCPTSGDNGVTLDCYTWTYDGRFQRESAPLHVQWPADGPASIPISSLSTYPLRFNPTGTLEEEIRNRGKMFWACRKRCFVGYDAPSTPFEMQVSNPRYMVDMGMYRELHEKESTTSGAEAANDDLINQPTPPDDPFILLLPPKILGFGLHDKKWKSLFVKYLQPVKWNKKAFEQLVLDPTKKELIEAMVTIHLSSNMSTDVIEGKGKSLIILLHGGPGTGKTLTAESVAELAQRPLYRVTCGDIGTDPENVEKYLESVLYIGSMWNAIVLLDESDVFLEEREKTDLQRNALVSVFLRVLEYYEGILILTSNRGTLR